MLALGLCACGAQDSEPANTVGDGFGGGEEVEVDVASPEIPDDAPLVVFLRDSIAAGLHLSPELAFPAAAQRLLAERGTPIRIYNAGISGDTTAGGLSRIDWLLRQEPDVVVVELGANDGLRGQPVENVEANLRGILEAVTDAGSGAVLLGMDVPTSLGGEYTTAFNGLYPRLAAEFDVPLVERFLDGVGGVPEMNLPDGLHPTAEGHRRLAENLADELDEALAAAAE